MIKLKSKLPSIKHIEYRGIFGIIIIINQRKESDFNKEVSKVKEALITQRKIGLSGNLYHKTQLDFAYNTNHIEGSTITKDETASIYDTGTILTEGDKVIVLKDATETKNHFTLFKYMLDTLDEELSEDMIKKFHFILKDGTLTDDEKEWFNVGEYKKKKTLSVISQQPFQVNFLKK